MSSPRTSPGRIPAMHDASVSKCDLHVHSKHSDRPSEWFLRRMGTPESFVEPQEVYRNARQAGMDFVTISDHNCIRGALEIAHLPGTFISNEVTTYFPENGSKVHILVSGINEEQFRMIQELRADIYRLQEYLMGEDIICSVAHALYRVNGRLTIDQFERLLLLFPRFELINGSRDRRAADLLGAILGNLTPEMIVCDVRPAGNRALRAAALEEGVDRRQRRSQRSVHGRGLYQDAAGLRGRRISGLSASRRARSRRCVRRQRADGPRLLSHRLQLLPAPFRPRQQRRQADADGTTLRAAAESARQGEFRLEPEGARHAVLRVAAIEQAQRNGAAIGGRLPPPVLRPDGTAHGPAAPGRPPHVPHRLPHQPHAGLQFSPAFRRVRRARAS